MRLKGIATVLSNVSPSPLVILIAKGQEAELAAPFLAKELLEQRVGAGDWRCPR